MTDGLHRCRIAWRAAPRATTIKGNRALELWQRFRASWRGPPTPEKSCTKKTHGFKPDWSKNCRFSASLKKSMRSICIVIRGGFLPSSVTGKRSRSAVAEETHARSVRKTVKSAKPLSCVAQSANKSMANGGLSRRACQWIGYPVCSRKPWLNVGTHWTPRRGTLSPRHAIL